MRPVTTEWREWDYPPHRNGPYRRYAPPTLGLDIRIERDGAGYPLQPRRSLRQRFLHAYARVMIGAIKLIAGAAAGLAVAIAIMFLVAIIRL
jgi:hypothetical protein